MKIYFALSLLLVTAFFGCGPTPTASPPIVAAPSSVPTSPPSISSPSPTAQPLASTAPSPTQPAPSEPAVLGRIDLVPLPGAGRTPAAVALLGNTLYVANRESDNLAVVHDRRVRAFIPTASGPTALLADTSRSQLYVATYVTPTVSIIANDGIVKTAELNNAAQSLALAGDNLLVGLGNTATIEVRNPTTLQKKGEIKLKEGFDVLLMVVDAPRHRLYANAYGWVVVLDLDTLTEISSFEAPYIFGSLAVNPNDGTIWGGVFDDKQSRGYLVSYDETGKVLNRVSLGPDLRGAAIDSKGRIFVTNSFMNQVAVVDTISGQFVSSIDVGVDPTSMALDDANQTLYVGDEGSDNVSIIDTSKLQRVGVIPVGMDVTALVANEERGRVYAASASTDSIFVIEHGQVVDEVHVGHHPVDLARDPGTNRLFVADYADGTIDVVNEDSLSVQTTLAITRSLSTVAVDPVNNHLFADSTMLTLDQLQPEGVYLAKGSGLGSRSVAEFVRVNPSEKKIYVFAYNGIPGSNSRTILYTFSEMNFSESRILPYRNGGNITAMAIDPGNGHVYGAVTHPLGYTSALEVWDSDDNNLLELSLGSRTGGMVLNPRTSHLFLAHAFTYEPVPGVLRKRDNAVQILDTRSLGEVGWIDVAGGPGVMTLLGDTVYVAGSDDGSITLIGDVATREAAPPTATFTPSPYPTLAQTIEPTGAPSPTNTPGLAPTVCVSPISEFSSQNWAPGVFSLLGCPIESEGEASFAAQQFEGGAMYYRDDEKRIYVLFDDRTWKGFDDTWNATLPEDSCPEVIVAKGQIKPIRGFGKVWCEQAGLREKIGAAASGEIGLYKAFAERFQFGLVFGPSNARQVRINQDLLLLNDGSWH